MNVTKHTRQGMASLLILAAGLAFLLHKGISFLWPAKARPIEIGALLFVSGMILAAAWFARRVSQQACQLEEAQLMLKNLDSALVAAPEKTEA